MKKIMLMMVMFHFLGFQAVYAGYLYGNSFAGDDNILLHRIYPVDWSITSIGLGSSYSKIDGGLAYNSDDGYLYGSSSAGENNILIHRINPIDWSITSIGLGSSYSKIDGGLTYIPEPFTLTLLALGGIALLRRRKMRH